MLYERRSTVAVILGACLIGSCGEKTETSQALLQVDPVAPPHSKKTGSEALRIILPAEVALEGLAISAENSLKIGPGAQVKKSVTGFATVASVSEPSAPPPYTHPHVHRATGGAW